MHTIEINKKNVLVKQYKGQRVVTFKDIDTVHGRVEGTAKRNFNTNKVHFIEGEDFFKIQPNEIRTVGIKSPNGGIVITESGYLMLVKSFTDELSWKVQRQLVKSYFRCIDETEPKQLELYDYFDKTYNGEPVLTTADVSHITGLTRSTVDWFLRTRLKLGIHFYRIAKMELIKFKDENPKINRLASNMYVINKNGFEEICRVYNIKLETPPVFAEPKHDTSFDEAFLKQTGQIIPSNNMHSLMGYIQRDAAEIQYYSSLLLTTDKKSKHEEYREKLAKVIRHIRSFAADIETIRI